MNDIYSISYELKDLLTNDERIILLNELDKKMNEDEEVIRLAYLKDVAVTNYNDALRHFSKDDLNVKKAQKELYFRKKELDEHPLVKKYLKAYSEVRDLYFAINDILFDGLSIKMKEHQ